MKKFFIFFLCVYFFHFSQAQTKNFSHSKPYLSVGVDAGFPVGRFATYYTFGFGGSVKYHQPFSPNLNATLYLGVKTFYGKEYTELFLNRYVYDKNNFIFLPAMVGAQYNFSKNFYIEPAIGYTFGIYQLSDFSDIAGLTWKASVGYNISQRFSLAANFQSVLVQSQSLNSANFRFAYNIYFAKKKKKN